jgi:competence protein ComEA
VQEDGAGGGRVVVHVAGAVRDPGVYRLPGDARVDDAVARAGGATRRADLGGLNLAARLEDGRQVLVPERARRGGGAGAAVAPSAGPAEGQPLNLNTATLEQLDTLSGIGPATAQKILDFREENGGFGSVEELGEIPGIGEKRLASLREEVTL